MIRYFLIKTIFSEGGSTKRCGGFDGINYLLSLLVFGWVVSFNGFLFATNLFINLVIEVLVGRIFCAEKVS